MYKKFLIIVSIFHLSFGNLNDFSINLYKIIANSSEDKNVVISPASVALATGLVLQGASGETRNEVERTLGIVNFENLIQKMDNDSLIESANKMFVSVDFPIKKSYQETVERIFKSTAQSVHFSDNRTLSIINSWIKDETTGIFENAIGYLDPFLKAVVINVISFKGNWKYNFNLKGGYMDFHYSTSVKSKIDFMYLKDTPLKFADLEKVQVLELPYEDTDISMVILLPKEIDGLKNLEEGLTVESLNLMLGKMENSPVNLAMPRFKIKFDAELVQVFKKLGIKLIFDEDKGEFDNLYSGDDLAVTDIVHKALIDVNENGTTAAALTALFLVIRTDSDYVTVDRPFLFMLKSPDFIFFIGRVVDPKYE